MPRKSRLLAIILHNHFSYTTSCLFRHACSYVHPRTRRSLNSNSRMVLNWFATFDSADQAISKALAIYCIASGINWLGILFFSPPKYLPRIPRGVCVAYSVVSWYWSALYRKSQPCPRYLQSNFIKILCPVNEISSWRVKTSIKITKAHMAWAYQEEGSSSLLPEDGCGEKTAREINMFK